MVPGQPRRGKEGKRLVEGGATLDLANWEAAGEELTGEGLGLITIGILEVCEAWDLQEALEETTGRRRLDRRREPGRRGSWGQD